MLPAEKGPDWSSVGRWREMQACVQPFPWPPWPPVIGWLWNPFKNVVFFYLFIFFRSHLVRDFACWQHACPRLTPPTLITHYWLKLSSARPHRDNTTSGTAGLFDVIALRPLNLIGGPGGTDSAEHCALEMRGQSVTGASWIWNTRACIYLDIRNKDESCQRLNEHGIFNLV